MSALSPDVLLMPSKLTPFAKELHGSLVVNPGMLTKGSSGGTYADITIHPVAENKLREAMSAGAIAAAEVDGEEDKPDAGMLHGVAARSYVSVVKI